MSVLCQKIFFVIVVMLFTLVAKAERGGDSDKPSIALDKLKREQKQTGKNLFSSKPWGGGTHRIVRTNTRASAATPDAVPTVPVAPPLPFVYVGRVLDEETGKRVVYLSKDGVPYVVTEGEVIEGMYRVDAVSDTELTLVYLPLNVKQKIIIGESNS